MKTKIKDLTNRQMNKICSKYFENNCVKCPLKRFNPERDRYYLYCYKGLRALYITNKLWYLDNWKDREDLEEMLTELKEEQLEVEDAEIDINEEEL